MIVGETPESAAARAYKQGEIEAWVRAHRERGFDLRTLDDAEMRLACYNELNKQLNIESLHRGPSFEQKSV